MLTSNQDPPAFTSPVAEIIGMDHHASLAKLCLNDGCLAPPICRQSISNDDFFFFFECLGIL
jgi:hypothetical protein